ncbi:head GIN domain-containing protein [Algivirga pacifica]|uniref:Putative auto-transporter adhesin head GIN domain-containing protein n=1 Tax=Algivirga pacifica TaxID=1162670 RepID=A0ABP9DE19_9BACT
MKKYVIALFTLVVLASCSRERISPTGSVITESRDVDAFSAISIHNGFRVKITMDSTESVAVEAHENVQRYVNVKQVGNFLEIEKDRWVSFSSDVEVTVLISAKTLERISGSAGTMMEVEGTLSAEDLKLVLSAEGNFKGTIEVETFEADLSGGSTLELTGNTGHCDLEISGGGAAEGFDFVTDTFEADLSGGSTVKMSINGAMDVSASGGSRVTYKGSGVVEREQLSGGSTIIKAE